MSVGSEIAKVGASGAGLGGLYIAGLAFILADVLPTPADAMYFNAQRKLRLELEAGKITPKQYWERDALYYYAFNVIWWLIVFLITVAVKGDTKRKAIVFISLLSGGAVVGVISNNIRKDEELMRREIPKA